MSSGSQYMRSGEQHDSKKYMSSGEQYMTLTRQ